MRKPERIPVILDEIKKVWEQCPDLRLGQLISNVFSDPYFIEDEDLVQALKTFYSFGKEDK